MSLLVLAKARFLCIVTTTQQPVTISNTFETDYQFWTETITGAGGGVEDRRETLTKRLP